jgi:hypothetical protein
MRILTLAVVLVAGCGTTRDASTSANSRLSRFELQSQQIDESENRCIEETLSSSNHQLASISTSAPAFVTQQTKKLTAERDHKLLMCRAQADHERDELTTSERAEYQNRAQEERNNNSLMTILTTSVPR